MSFLSFKSDFDQWISKFFKNKVIPEIWISNGPNSLHFQLQVMTSTPHELFTQLTSVLLRMKLLEPPPLLRRRPRDVRSLLRRDLENRLGRLPGRGHQLTRNSMIHQLKASDSRHRIRNDAGWRCAILITGAQRSEIDLGRSLKVLLLGEDLIGQDKVRDAERVLQELGENIVVGEGGSAAGGDRRRRGSAEIDGDFQHGLWCSCHSWRDQATEGSTKRLCCIV